MADEPQTSAQTDSIAAARERVGVSAMPEWVIACAYPSEFKAAEQVPVTYLLLNNQVHAERHESFVQHVIRLETMDAVQHFSQWRLQFEPKTQQAFLHTLKIRRGELEMNHLNLDKAHLLQREEGLERFVIGGWYTLLMILEDVRPGDILEYAYTIRNKPRFLENNNSPSFNLPGMVTVGKYHFSAQFAPGRDLKWKSSAPSLSPAESKTDTAVTWQWNGENYTGAKPEAHTPQWYPANPWIQISDFPDWKTIAAAIYEAWCTEASDEAVAQMAREIEAAESELTARIEKAIRLVQDEHRYLSVNLEFGGQIPNPSGTVLQRRFGDCKDLSWLLVNLLKKLGVAARPILVNTSLAKTIKELLPSPLIFNHVVVEFEADGKRRWVDTTISQQGGGPFKRGLADFAFGLPVDNSGEGLVAQPQISDRSNLIELQETILLDTRNGLSRLAVIQQNEGNYADGLRQQITLKGSGEMARQRAQSTAGRFRDAQRFGELQFRDDRENNQFVLAETFEFRPVFGGHANPQLCRFQMPTNWITGVVALPEKVERKTPFALPYPCRIAHTIDIESPAIQRMKINDPRSQLNNSFVEFSRADKTGHEYLRMKLMVETKTDAVPASQVVEHAKFVEQLWASALRELSIQKGYGAPLKKRGFGELPAIATKAPPAPALPPAIPIAPRPQPVPGSKPHAPSNRKRSRDHTQQNYNRQNFPTWLKIALGVLVVLGSLLIILVKYLPHPHP